MKNEKGITLIALVITIIVMLILVTVTIRVATNGNLFTHAANAAKGTKSAIADENAILDGNVGDKSIGTIVAEQTGVGSGAATTYIAYDIEDIITISGEDFYVIEDSDEHTSTVKLLAKYNVDTSTNKQSASAGTVAFDSTETTNDYNYNNADVPTIKPIVNSYVFSLGVTVQEKRLLLKSEAETLMQEHSSVLRPTNFWLEPDSLNDLGSDRGLVLDENKREELFFGNTDIASPNGLRPVIVILKSNIPVQ